MQILFPRNSADIVRKKVFQLIYVSNKWLLPDLRFLIYNEKGSIIFLLGFYWLNYAGIPHFTYCIFYKFKVCGNSTSSKSVGTIFPIAFAHFVSLGHILKIISVCRASSLLLYRGNQWSLMLLLQKNSDLLEAQVISTF